MHYTTEGKILVADDEFQNLDLVSRLMTRRGYDVVGASRERALEAVARERPDIVLLGVRRPGLDGFEVCRRLKESSITRLTPVILMAELTAADDRMRGIEAGADDFLSTPFVVAELEARVRSLTRLKRYTDELDSAESVILSLALTIEARDHYTGGHCERLSACATAFGVRLGLNDEQRVALYRGGFLHDVGKVGVPDAVLLKQGPLLASECRLMREHPVIGDNLCSQLQTLHDVRPIVRHHHERADGSGYPDRLHGDDVPLLASVMGIVDGYDAMTTVRPYRPALTPEKAVRELRREAKKGWKRVDLVEAFIDLVEGPGFESIAAPRSAGTRPLSALAYVIQPDAGGGIAAAASRE